ncbi:hypothetical protein AMAG_18660 [Allomyces macrogynus ATCC 38327]|uniref:Uncharacterized protein n=1 Tax=Allomyces macrogynus (strain ATCC 38327) TaxID=578462 RepID=A0A0L0SGI0_ALLM3|nr:hypothetical protein AMAG_18660 [Allomyces macrogynus ATCC 38327]|eukprot:KNE61623.1 hypothetical protein AMAG_18660 [Allomyces macrogynus ATCC 38327]
MINIASQVASPIVLQDLLEYLAIEGTRHKGLPAPSQWVGRGFLLVLAIFLLQCRDNDQLVFSLPRCLLAFSCAQRSLPPFPRSRSGYRRAHARLTSTPAKSRI